MKVLASIMIIAVALALLSGSPTWAYSDGIYNYISKVQVGDDDYLYINVPPNFSNNDHCVCPQPAPPGCLGPWYAVSKHNMSDDRTKAQMQIALASYLGHKEVYVQTDGCRADKRLLLEAIQIQQP